jgi:hypothetical protein
VPDELGEEGIERAMQFGRDDCLKFAQSVPELDAGVIAYIPGFPGDIVSLKAGASGSLRMGNEGESARVVDSVDEGLRIVCQVGYIAVGVEHQQVVLLRVTVLVVDLLSNQEQDAAAMRRGSIPPRPGPARCGPSR